MVVAAVIILGAGVLTEFFSVIRAPLGYQDEKGFHKGAESAEDASGSAVKRG